MGRSGSHPHPRRVLWSTWHSRPGARECWIPSPLARYAAERWTKTACEGRSTAPPRVRSNTPSVRSSKNARSWWRDGCPARTALTRLGAEVEEQRPEDEEHYIDVTPVIFVIAAVVMAIRFVSLGLDDESLYILSGIGFAVFFGLRPFISKLMRPKD
jgi:hypothetical protein